MKPKQSDSSSNPIAAGATKPIAGSIERGIDYETVDVIADEAAYDEMIRLSDQELAPVIDVDGRILADFGPEQLARFWYVGS